jgi:hypothetical protein
MIRVFMKRGWGMTDEQFLMYMFGKDIAIKVGIMFQLKKTINGTLETIEKMHRRSSGGGGAQAGYEQTRKGTIIEEDEDNSYEVEDYGYEQEQEQQQPQGDNFTSSMNINTPQNPVDPTKGHPKEVQNVLRNERKNK